MILTCPACATSYFAPDEAIGPNGRKVRCQSCGETWRAAAEEPLELTDAAAPAPAVAAAADFGRREEAPETLAETPAPELPKAFRARAEQQRRLRRAATHGAVWAGLASVFIGLLGAGWLFRVEVVDMYPRAATAYAAIGAPVNPTGLDFEAVGARARPDNPEMVLVSGALRNVRDNEIVAPPVRIALLDAQGAEVGHTVVRIDAAPVLPGKVQGFAALIPDPGGKGAGVGVDFVLTGSSNPEPQASAPRAPRARPLPVAESGLRPAIPETHITAVADPVDAAPLDSGHDEAVSASHHG